jgi:hypothetical protein
MARKKPNAKPPQPRSQPIPPGATQKASDRTSRPGGPPPSPLGDPHAAGTPGGGTEVGGLGGTNIDEGSPRNADLEEAMGSGTQEPEAEQASRGYGGPSGGAVGGTPAGKRTSENRRPRGIKPGGVHRGDSTIGTDPASGSE